MSQHSIETTDANGRAVTVIIGYDRPLNYVFCLVELRNIEPDIEDWLLYNNLADPKVGTRQQDVGYFKSVLDNMGISVPMAMFEQVEADQAGRVGNREVRYEPEVVGN